MATKKRTSKKGAPNKRAMLLAATILGGVLGSKAIGFAVDKFGQNSGTETDPTGVKGLDLSQLNAKRMAINGGAAAAAGVAAVMVPNETAGAFFAGVSAAAASNTVDDALPVFGLGEVGAASSSGRVIDLYDRLDGMSGAERDYQFTGTDSNLAFE